MKLYVYSFHMFVSHMEKVMDSKRVEQARKMEFAEKTVNTTCQQNVLREQPASATCQEKSLSEQVFGTNKNLAQFSSSSSRIQVKIFLSGPALHTEFASE